MLRDGYARLLAVSQTHLRAAAGELADGIDPEQEGAMLFFAVQGLIGPTLIGLLTPDQALDVLDHQLDRIFRR